MSVHLPISDSKTLSYLVVLVLYMAYEYIFVTFLGGTLILPLPLSSFDFSDTDDLDGENHPLVHKNSESSTA